MKKFLFTFLIFSLIANFFLFEIVKTYVGIDKKIPDFAYKGFITGCNIGSRVSVKEACGTIPGPIQADDIQDKIDLQRIQRCNDLSKKYVKDLERELEKIDQAKE